MLNIDQAKINLNNIINNPEIITLLENNFNVINDNIISKTLVSDIKNIIQVPLFTFFDNVVFNTKISIRNLEALEYLDALVGLCIFNKINIDIHKSDSVNYTFTLVKINDRLSINSDISNCVKRYASVGNMLHISAHLDPMAEAGTLLKKFIYSFVGFLSLTDVQKQSLLTCKTINVATIYRVTLVTLYDICMAIDNSDLYVYIVRRMLKHYYLNAVKYKGYVIDLLAIDYKTITLNSDRNALKILNEQNEIFKGLIESTL